MTLTLSDGTSFEVLGNFLGATQSYQITNILSKDNGISVVRSFNAGLLRIKGITASGSLFLTENSNYININSNVSPTASQLDIANLNNNTLVYLKTNSQISSTTVGISYDGQSFNGTLVYDSNGNQKNKLNPSYKIKFIGPVERFEDPIYLNANDAGLFYLNTPIGIKGITGTFQPNETISLTVIPENENVWYFPENVYFENGENYLTCGKSVINLISSDEGKTWLATVSARGFDVSENTCVISNTLGSCCYTNAINGTSTCLDYTTRDNCDTLFGTFNPLLSCEKSCGDIGICCTSGKCIEDVSPTECAAFGGSFFRGITCGAYDNDPNSNNFGNRLCPDLCETNTNIECCVNGQSVGQSYTRLICENYFNGVAVLNPPDNFSCCDSGIGVGPCCTEDGCFEFTKLQCQAINGVYMGESLRCEEVNCECVSSNILGSCCLDGFCQSNVTESFCDSRDGAWSSQPCSQRNCQNLGSCCVSGGCVPDQSEELCAGLGGVFFTAPCSPGICNTTGSCCRMIKASRGVCVGGDSQVIQFPGAGGLTCIDGLTPSECLAEPYSRWRPGVSCDSDPCSRVGCCFSNIADCSSECFDTHTPKECFDLYELYGCMPGGTPIRCDSSVISSEYNEDDVNLINAACESCAERNSQIAEGCSVCCKSLCGNACVVSGCECIPPIECEDGGPTICPAFTNGEYFNEFINSNCTGCDNCPPQAFNLLASDYMSGEYEWELEDINPFKNLTVSQLSCNASKGPICNVKFNYCDLSIKKFGQEKKWIRKKKSVNRNVQVPAGSPPVPCDILNFESCSETREKIKNAAICCAAKKFGCSDEQEKCTNVPEEYQSLCGLLTDEMLFTYLRRFVCDARDFIELPQEELETYFCQNFNKPCLYEEDDCQTCCDDSIVSSTPSNESTDTYLPRQYENLNYKFFTSELFDANKTKDAQDISDVPESSFNRGAFKISYRTCNGSTINKNEYNPCKPQTAIIIDPCCMSEINALGLYGSSLCVKSYTSSCENESENPIFYAKFIINNEPVCLPVSCTDCSQYEPCES
jgi:hypothetical protein